MDDRGQFQYILNYKIDEKYVYIMKIRQKFYLLPEESKPSCQVNNKFTSSKSKFLAANGWPLFDIPYKQVFSGKLEI